jgi:hypothetical protein
MVYFNDVFNNNANAKFRSSCKIKYITANLSFYKKLNSKKFSHTVKRKAVHVQGLQRKNEQQSHT